MRLAAAVVLVGLLAGLLGAAGSARADAPPDADEPPVEGWSADPRLWLALIEWRQRLRLELASSRELCTAGTLTEVSWEISGGKPPYSLQVEGASVDVDADNARINCGALSEAEAADEGAALAAKRISAVVTDARGVRREAAIDVARARALPAPANIAYVASLENVLVLWDEVPGASSQSPQSVHPVTRNQLKVSAAVRTRPNRDGAAWSYHVVDTLRHTSLYLEPPPDLRVFSVAAVRHPLELETPNALNWSEEIIYGATKPAQNVTLTATHDTVTVSWDRQPYAHSQRVELRLFAAGDVTGPSRRAWMREEPGVSGRHQVTFNRVPANTDLSVAIDMTDPDSWEQTATFHAVRTKPAPDGWTPPARGPQNLRYVVTDGVLEILWDEPFPNAQRHWMVLITDPVTGRSIGERAGVSSWTLSPWIGVAPATRYQATVIHVDLAGGQATIDIMTPPSSGDAQSTPSDVSPSALLQLHSFFPVWPVGVESRYTMTDDPFQWRVGPTDNHGLTARAETTILRYSAYDAAGVAASAGSYAFLTDAASVVATYEGLRDGTAKRLLIHKSDAQGVSRATLYDAVAAGDFFEWRETDDCWVRYRVTEVLPDPAGGAPRKLLAVEWTTYAFTGCGGAIAADAAVAFDWGPLPDLGGTCLAAPIRHGPFQVVPEGWEGPVEEDPFRPWPGNSYANPVTTAELAEARRLPHWRDPTLPSGWTLLLASSGDPSYDPPYGYCAFWANDRGYGGVEICGGFYLGRGQPWESSRNAGRAVVETRMIVGRPAIVVYSPAGPNHNRYRVIEVWVYDPAPDAVYNVMGFDCTLNGSNVDAVIAIARSLFEE